MAPANPISILCISPDRPLLRRLGNLLRTFGYQVVNSTDLKTIGSFRRYVNPAICIIDENKWDTARKAIRELHGAGDTPPPFTILLWDEGSELDPTDALEAGVDDVLAKPIRHAEVLTRLRSAARLCEWNRRIAGLATIHPATKLLSEHGLIARLKQLGQKEKWTNRTALVILEIDLFREQAQYLGDETTQSLEQAFVQIAQKQETKGLIAHLAPGRLAVALGKVTLKDAEKRAEELRKAVVDKLQPRCTLSVGVAVLEPADKNVQGLFDRGHQALRLAQLNGRNCVVASGEFDQEQEQWQESIERGNPFAQNSAGDVMIPFTTWLTPEETVRAAQEKFDRTQLPLLPVWTDEDGLVGLVRAEQCVGNGKAKGSARTTIKSVMSDDFIRMEVDEDYDHVMRHFMKHRAKPIVLCQDDAPRGFVMCDNLVAMVAAIDESSFPATDRDSGCKRFLVPDNHPKDQPPALAT